MSPQIRRERLRRDQLDLVAQDAFEEVAELNEVVKGLLSGCELDKEVDIASRAGSVATDRAEERKATDAEPEDTG